MTDQSQKQSTSLIAEANRLLAKRPWKLIEGFYAESTAVSLFIDPMPGQVDGRYHVPLTIFPLVDSVENLQGTTVSLTQGSAAGAIYYGQLDKRGQVLFRDLQPGTYHCLGVNEPDNTASPQPLLSVLPPLAVAPPTASAEGELYRFINANQSLQVILRRKDSNYFLSFQTQDEKWQNKLIGFSWTPLFSTEQNLLLAQPQKLLAILTKHETEDQFEAEVNVGQACPAFVLCVSNQPWAWQGLSSEAESMVRHSVASAANEQSRRAWQTAVGEESLSAVTKTMLRQVLADMHSSPGRLWWRQAEAAGEQISRLINSLQVFVRSEIATFSGLPSEFHAPRLATAVTRSQLQENNDPNPIQIVPLTAPSQTFALHLIVGPVSGKQTTFSIQVMDILLQQPLPRVRINLFNDQKQLLEGDMTREDGLVTFQALEPNTYFVNIGYRDERLELPITFTAEG
ncbi:MAG: hypothetical protein H6654_07305 [Ardenticatenaceae bacterium]|nr:hypothetical protein [Anaerolineales bacterium]MCB8940332.1 hypothetical protein [Ardenticatenaceae bacterium]MCB8973348.1 hypothetical protein [Ardenticatenaceae bacterium]